MNAVVVASLIALVIFGVPIAVLGGWLFSRPWKSSVRTLIFLAAAAGLWLASGSLGFELAKTLPVDWGHASTGYVVGFFLGSLLAMALVTVWLIVRAHIFMPRERAK